MDAFCSREVSVAASGPGGRLRVSHTAIERMTAAGATIRACRRHFAARGASLLGEITGGGAAIQAWRYYPDGEVYDPKSHAQYFFHAHSGSGQPGAERGHFHTFLRADGMPPGAAPLLLPELAVADAPMPPQAAPVKRGARDEVSHLIAIAIDGWGEPVRLFTTNRWVTGETWYPAEDVIRMLDQFVIAEAAPSAVLNCWLGAMIQLFRPQIASLLRARDETVMAWRRRRRTAVLEDPRLEIPSSLEIDLDSQLAFVERAAGDSSRSTRLPSMAEGWEEGGPPSLASAGPGRR
jgi:hypothetical protein